jgi:hypothetical protein
MRSFRCAALFASLAVISTGMSVYAQQPAATRPVAISDLFALRDVHDPQMSPDGSGSPTRSVRPTLTKTNLKSASG